MLKKLNESGNSSYVPNKDTQSINSQMILDGDGSNVDFSDVFQSRLNMRVVSFQVGTVIRIIRMLILLWELSVQTKCLAEEVRRW